MAYEPCARGPAAVVIKSIRVQRQRSSDWHYSRPAVVVIVLIIVCHWHQCSGGRGCQRLVETGLNQSCGGSPMHRILVNRNWSISKAHRTATTGPVATSCSPVQLQFFPAHTTGLLNTKWNRFANMGRVYEDHCDGSHYIVVLKSIQHAYIALHQYTDDTPIAFSASTTNKDILSSPSSYPRCNIILCNLLHPASLAQDPLTSVTAQTSPHLQQHIVPPIASPVNNDTAV